MSTDLPIHDLWLASGSPRRRELLRQIGVACRVLPVEIDENVRPGEAALDYVQRLAGAKAAAGWSKLSGAAPLPVLGADTSVVVDGQILGKPTDRDAAIGMLLRLAGRTHRVLTAVALRSGDRLRIRTSATDVSFRTIDAEEAAAYWRTGEPRDKAGGYAIQGYAAVFVNRIDGSYSGVVGLPLHETAELLAEAGVPRWRGS